MSGWRGWWLWLAKWCVEWKEGVVFMVREVVVVC